MATTQKALLESVVEWLRSNDEVDVRWEASTEHVELCLSEMRLKILERERPAYMGHKPGPNADIEAFRRSLTDVENTLTAMRQRNRRRALDAGTAALAKLR
jgi:hypothetical protein